MGKNILSGPMRFEVKQDGRLQPVTAQLQFTEKKPNRVVAVSNWSAGALQRTLPPAISIMTAV